MAAAGPSLVIKWNTSLRIRSLLHHLLINLLPLILLFLFPPVAARLCPLYLDVFFFFFTPMHPISYTPLPYSLLPPGFASIFPPMSNCDCALCHSMLPCFPACLPAFPGEEKATAAAVQAEAEERAADKHTQTAR